MNTLKNIACLLLLIISTHSSFAQKNNVQNAFRALEKKSMQEAVDYIELAASNSKTSNDVKMHNYRGKIYFEIYSNEEYNSIDPMAIYKCAESWEIVYNHPKAKKWFDDNELSGNISKAGVGLFNKGISFYNTKDYSSATKMFTKIFDLIPIDEKKNLERSNVTKESIWLNLFYVSYAQKNNLPKEYLQKLIDVNYQDPQIYSYMSNILLERKRQEGSP